MFCFVSYFIADNKEYAVEFGNKGLDKKPSLVVSCVMY